MTAPPCEHGTADQLAAELLKYWRQRGFYLCYQPQFDLITNRVIAFEALLRWDHPTRGEVSPVVFIPLAEETGLIDDVGQWVLDKACREACTWPAPLYVAVNVSAKQLKSGLLAEVVNDALQASGLPPWRLELEITESSMLTANSCELEVLHKIKKMGVRIVMDDFDVGYSSFSYLMYFPFDKIKLDKTFIDGVRKARERHSVARAIVQSIVSLSAQLHIALVAEGVETKEQLEILIALGCTQIQGYLCGRPILPASITTIIENSTNSLGLTDKPGSKLVTADTFIAPIPFELVAESMNDILVITTSELLSPGPTIVYVNPAFTKLTGYSAAEVAGLTPRILQGPGTNRATLDTIRTALQAGLPVREKILNFAKSGAPYWLDLNIAPLRNSLGDIIYFAAFQRDVTMDKRRLDELEYLADRDTLTGIPNRRAFFRAAESEIDRWKKQGSAAVTSRSACLAFIDVDRFKKINDELGHAAGDTVLCGLADCLTDNVRRIDILGRIGGEEFAVFMPSVTLAEAKSLAERLRRAIADTQMATALGPINITVSIGVADFLFDDSIKTMGERADLAMYAAKRSGRNRVRSNASRFVSSSSN